MVMCMISDTHLSTQTFAYVFNGNCEGGRNNIRLILMKINWGNKYKHQPLHERNKHLDLKSRISITELLLSSGNLHSSFNTEIFKILVELLHPLIKLTISSNQWIYHQFELMLIRLSILFTSNCQECMNLFNKQSRMSIEFLVSVVFLIVRGPPKITSDLTSTKLRQRLKG